MKPDSSEIKNAVSQATFDRSPDPIEPVFRYPLHHFVRGCARDDSAVSARPKKKAPAQGRGDLHPSGERQRHQSAAETPIDRDAYILVAGGQSFVSAFSALVASALVL